MSGVIDEEARQADEERVAAGRMPAWGVAELPAPPPFRLDPRRLIGPGLLMAGAAIGGGEWLAGPATTAKYGGVLMWLATLSILFQAAYNIEAMRYTLYTGETIFVGYFRTAPGPRFWIWAYLVLDFGATLPYLSANAAVPLLSAVMGRLPAPDGSDTWLIRLVGYAIFIGSAIPLAFGGQIYRVVERMMVAKIILVLGYLLFLGFFYVDASTWREIFVGLVSVGELPRVDGRELGWWEVLRATFTGENAPIDLALLGAFAAVAGQGGLTNLAFSSYAREKGWGMGKQVGAIPSIVGGKGIALSHFGKVFHVTSESLARWRAWIGLILRDQFGIWVIGCILGMAIPSLVSLQFVRGRTVTNDNVAALTAQGLVDATGLQIFWFTTLFCGFIVLAPSQISSMDGFLRRWTDVIWTGSRRLSHLSGDKVMYVYYLLMLGYLAWGLVMLTVLPSPQTLLKATGTLLNFGLGVSALHTLWVNCFLLPREIRPNWLMRLGLIGCALFFIAIAIVSVPQTIRSIKG